MQTQKLYRRLPLSPLGDMDMPRAATNPACTACDLSKGVGTVCMDAELWVPPGANVAGPILGLVLDYPSRGEDGAGRPLLGQTGKMVRDLVAQHWKGRVFIDNAMRCFPADTLVSAPDVLGGYRREYTGPMVRITSSDNWSLSGTPNHPALTLRGWVALGDLQEGDDLVSGFLPERVGPGDPHVDHRPAEVGQVFDSLAGLTSPERRPCVDVDFHGDGGQCQVDVVLLDGELRGGFNTASLEHRGQVVLEATDHHFGDRHGAGTVGLGESNLVSGPDTPSASYVGGGGLGGPSTGGSTRVHRAGGVTLAAQGNTSAQQGGPNTPGPDADELPELIKRGAIHVTTRKISKIERYTFSGHVYNLHTASNWYCAEGVIVHNCGPRNARFGEDNADACQPYGAARMDQIAPDLDRMVVMGTWATYATLGFKVPVQSARGGYGWYLDESRLDCGVRAAMVPVYILPSPHAAIRNRWMLRDFKEDLTRALTRPTPHLAAIDTQIKLVENCNDATDFAAWAHQQSAVAFDTETAGKMHNRNFRVHAVSFASPDDPSVVWVFGRKALADEKVIGWVRSILQNEDIPKIGQNLKYDMLAMWCAFRIQTQAFVLHDTRLIRKLLEATIDAGLDVAATLVGMGGHKDEANAQIKAIRSDLALLAGEPLRAPLASGKPRKPVVLSILRREDVDPAHLDAIRASEDTWSFAYGYLTDDVLHRYNALDALSTALLFDLIYPRIAALPGRHAVYTDVTMTAVRALFEMEKVGMLLDVGAAQQFSDYLGMKLAEIDARLKVYGDINFNSPDQLAELLYDKLGLPEPKNSRTASGKRGTGEEVLDQLSGKHKIVRDILERRSLVKLKGTYADAFMRFRRDDGRIHPTTLIDGAESGRLSCVAPWTLVRTARGDVPITEVKVGDLVWTHKHRWRHVLSQFPSGRRLVYDVTFCDGKVLTCTSGHRLLTDDGRWVRVEEVIREYLENMAGRPGEHEAGCRALSLALAADCAEDRGADGGYGADRERGASGVDSRCGASGVGGGALLRVEGGGQESDARQARVGAPEVERGVPGWARLPDVLAQREAAVRTPGGDGECAGDVGAAGESGGAPHRRRQDEQQPGQPRVGDSRRARSHSLAPATGTVVCTVEAVHYRGGCEVYDLTVEEDESYETAGVFSHNSSDPNMQNAPSPDRDDPAGTQYGHMTRDCFIAAAGYIFVEVDTAQQEARVAAKLSGDEVLVGCFASGEDIHRTTASVVFGIAPANVTKKQRTDCKTVFFGLLYGKTDYGLAKQLNISEQEAKRIRAVILGRFKKLAKWCESQIAYGRTHGGVFTWWDGHEEARWRPLYGIAAQGDEGKGARFNAENSTINTPVQGLAGDIVTGSLWQIVQRMKAEGLDARLVNTVHDSVMVEVRIGEEHMVACIMRDVILGQNCEGVQLAVDFKKGTSWGSMEPWAVDFSLYDAQKASA